jgi:hypothetical protein
MKQLISKKNHDKNEPYVITEILVWKKLNLQTITNNKEISKILSAENI